MKQEKKALDSPFEFGLKKSILQDQEKERRPLNNSNDFRVDILELEGKLDQEEFLEWLSTVKWIFKYKEILDNKKVKLVALKLKKYTSLWWTSLHVKRVKNFKDKIQTWEK